MGRTLLTETNPTKTPPKPPQRLGIFGNLLPRRPSVTQREQREAEELRQAIAESLRVEEKRQQESALAKAAPEARAARAARLAKFKAAQQRRMQEEAAARAMLHQPVINDPEIPPFSTTQLEEEKSVSSELDKGNVSVSEPSSIANQEIQVPQFSMSWHRSQTSISKPIGSGLRNLGNSCYMNSSLQVLSYIPPLNQLFEENNSNGFHDPAKCTKARQESDSPNSFCSLCECVALLPRLTRLPPSTIPEAAVRPVTLHNHLSDIHPFLRRGYQEDAHEFIQALINKWEEEQEAMKEESPILVSNLIGGTTRTTTRCGRCGNKSVRDEKFGVLSVDVSPSLNESLLLFSSSEILRDDDAYFCDGCDGKKIAKKSIRVLADEDHSVPPVLIIHLKRFKMTDWTGVGGNWKEPVMLKLDDFVSFPLELELGDYLLANPLTSDSSHSYECTGVVVHAGANLGCGHYYANVKSRNGKWYRMNDSSVREISANAVKEEQAYLLVYVKKDDVAKEMENHSAKELVVGAVEDPPMDSSLAARVVDDYYSDRVGADTVLQTSEDDFERVPALHWNMLGKGDGPIVIDPHWIRGDWVDLQ